MYFNFALEDRFQKLDLYIVFAMSFLRLCSMIMQRGTPRVISCRCISSRNQKKYTILASSANKPLRIIHVPLSMLQRQSKFTRKITASAWVIFRSFSKLSCGKQAGERFFPWTPAMVALWVYLH